MGTEGNSLTQAGFKGTVGNAITPTRITSQEIIDPTLADGDGTYSVTIPNSRSLESEDVLGMQWDGPHRARLNSVTDATVEVIFEEPNGSGSFTTVADGTITGTLEVYVNP